MTKRNNRQAGRRIFTATLKAAAWTAALVIPITAGMTQDNPAAVRAKPVGPDGLPVTPESAETGAQKEDLLAYADLLFSQKQYALAARQYQIFLKQYPQSPNIQAGWFRLGECYLQVGQTEDAVTTFTYVVNTYKTGAFVGSAAYRLAVLNYNAKKYVEAQKYFAVAAEHLSSPEAKLPASFYLARCLQFIEKPKEAIAAYEKVLGAEPPPSESTVKWKNPFRERCLLETARLLYDLGDTDAAFVRFEELSGNAEDPEIREESLARAGLLATEMGDVEKSNRYLEKALAIEGDSPWKSLATIGLIFNHFAREEYDEVLAIYNRGVFDAPSDTRPKMLLIVGHSHRLTGNLDSAVDLYTLVEKNYRDRPEGAEAAYRKLQCLHEQKDGGLSVYIDRFVAEQRPIDPENAFIDLALLMKAESHFAAAQVAESRDLPDVARENYGTAAEAYTGVRESNIPDKYHEPRLYKLGWSQVEAGDATGGITALGRFTRRFPDSSLIPSALAKRATTYRSIDDFEAAIADYREIVDRFPKAAEVEFALQQIALIHGNRREIPFMISAYEELLEKFPETPGAAEAHYWIGVGNFDQEKYEEALEPLDRARKLEPETYAAKASLRIILAHYQTEKLGSLAREAGAYLDGRTSELPATQPGGEPAAAGRKLPADRPSIPPQVLSYLGQHLFDNRDFEQAEKFLTGASTPEKPANTSSDVWDLLGQSRMEIGKYAEAIEPWDIYLTMTERPTNRGKAYLAKGEAYYNLKQFEEAREAARECLKTIKQGRVNAKARMLLGDITAAEGDMAGAAREYLVVSQIFIDDEITPVALQKAAKAYREAGETAKADQLETQLKSSFPDFKGTASAD